MTILAVGLSHRTAPTAMLELVTVGLADRAKTLHELAQAAHVAEAVVVMTCNRVEIYADVTAFHGGHLDVTDLLARAAGVPVDELQPHLYVDYDVRAVQHLFSVACGLDSMLVGESQVGGQLRAAFKLAREERVVGRVLSELFSHALRVGKRARTETGIDRAGASLVGVGVALAANSLGSLAGRSALVIGAGSTGSLAGQALRRAGVGTVTVANRSADRGARLAKVLGGRSIGLDELGDAIAAADVVVSSTASTGVVVDVGLADATRTRPLFVLDLALPRDVAPAVGALPGVTLVDLDGLRTELGAEQAGADVEAVRRIVADEVAAFVSWQRATRVAPTVVALRSKADALVQEELLRLSARLPELDTRTRDELADTVRRVVEKLLHAPTVRVKELAGSPGGEGYAEALRELFELDRHVPEAVSAPDLEVGP